MNTTLLKRTGIALAAAMLPLSAQALAPPAARDGPAAEAAAGTIPGVTLTLASASIIPEAQAATPRAQGSLTATPDAGSPGTAGDGTTPSATEEAAGGFAMFFGGLAIVLLIVRRRLQWANLRERTITVPAGRHADLPPERPTSPFGPPESHNAYPADR